MVLPQVAKFAAKATGELFDSISALRKIPKTNYDDRAPTLWRGLRDNSQFDILPNGDLSLNPGKNFGGKTTGISFTNDRKVALSYASRQPETPVPYPGGVLVKVKRDIFEDVDDFFEDSFDLKNRKPRLKYEGMEGEEAFYTDKPFVIPKGSWGFENPNKEVAERARRAYKKTLEDYFEASDEELLKTYADDLLKTELEEYSGGYDLFGFSSSEALQKSLANSDDQVAQFLYHLTGLEPGSYADRVIKAKINMSKNPDDYIKKLNELANKHEISGLYGQDWFLN